MSKSLIKRVLIFPFFLFLIAAGITGCSTMGIDKSQPQFASRVESAAGEFENRTSRSDPPAPDLPEMTAQEHERLGDNAYSGNELANAYFQYEKCIEKDPSNYRVMIKQGMLLLAGGLNEKAAGAFKDIAEKVPDYAPAYEGLGLALFRRNLLDDAEKAFRQAVALDPDLWKSYTYLGIIHDARKEFDQAADAYTKALRASPENESILYNNLGVSYHRSGNIEKSVKVFRTAINKNKASHRIYNNLGRALGNIGKYELALSAFMKAGGKAQAYNNLGCLFLDSGDFDNAIANFKKAIAARPEFYVTAGENLEYAREGRNRRENRSQSAGSSD